MHQRLSLFSLFSLTAFATLSACTLQTGHGEHDKNFPRDQQTVTIGTFNIAWLGDGNNDREPRTEEEYQYIARVIADAAPDVLGVEEVENRLALERVMKYLNGYDCIVGNNGGEQNVAVL